MVIFNSYVKLPEGIARLFFHIEVMRNRGLPYSDFWVSSPWSSLGFHSNMPGHPSPQSIHNYIYIYTCIYRLLYILYIYVNHNSIYIDHIYIYIGTSGFDLPLLV